MTPEALEELHNSPQWKTLAAWLDHVDGRVTGNPCLTCKAAQGTALNGCEEGRRLWGMYREARITPVSTQAK